MNALGESTTADSRIPGKWSMFCLKEVEPARPQAGEPLLLNTLGEGESLGTHRSEGLMARILVVDDEWRIREMLRILLEDAGHSITTASDGHGALESLDTEGIPDLILLDLSMPGMDGWKVIDELYRSGRRELTRILVVTGMDDAPRMSPDILHKPFDATQLTMAVNRALAETPQEQCARRARLDGLGALLRPMIGGASLLS